MSIDVGEKPRTTRGWRDFRLLWGGQSTSLLGDQILMLALPLAAAHELGASTFEVGVLAAATKLPYLLIGLPAGVWVARVGLRRSMVGADFLRGAAVLSMPLAWLAGLLTLTHLLVAALFIGVCSVFFQVAYQSFTPLLISDDDRLHGANARMTFSESMALLVGPGLAGLLIGLTGAVRAMVVDAVTFLVSTVTLLSIRHREPRREVAAGPKRSMWREVGDGIGFVVRHPVLRLLMAAGLAFNLGISMYMAMVALFAVDYLHLSPGAFGLAIGLGGAGFPLGSVLARWLSRRYGIGPALGIVSLPIICGLAITVSAFGGYAAVMMAAGTFIYGAGSGAFKTNALTIRHLVTPDAMATRATAVHRFVTWGVMPVGSVAAGIIASTGGLRAAMVTAVAVAGLCAIPVLSRTMRRTKTITRTES